MGTKATKPEDVGLVEGAWFVRATAGLSWAFKVSIVVLNLVGSDLIRIRSSAESL
jgi:hypothetical protein